MCGVGEPGELLLSGPRLGRGYRGRPDLTADKFVPNPFYDTTADLPPEIRLHYQKVYHTGELQQRSCSSCRCCISLLVSARVTTEARQTMRQCCGAQPSRHAASCLLLTCPCLPLMHFAGDLVRWGADGQLEFLGRKIGRAHV